MRSRIFAIAIAAAFQSSATADICNPADHVEGKSADGRYVVYLDAARPSWDGRLVDTKSGAVTEAKMVGDWIHCHFDALVPDDGSRVVLIEQRVDNRKFANLLVYDGSLKLLKAFTLSDLLNDADRASMRRSISHIDFVGFDKEKKRSTWLEDGGKTFAILLRSGRIVRVSLAEPKIIPDKVKRD